MDRELTRSDLNTLEHLIDAIFAKVGIDVTFTRHFLERLNDARNQNQITMRELGMLFAKEYKQWGKPIAQMGPDSQAVLKDLESDINIPFILKWNEHNKELELVAKTIMRKKKFTTQDREFKVEDVNEDLASAVNSITNTSKTVAKTIGKVSKIVPKPIRKVIGKVAPRVVGPLAVLSDLSDLYDAGSWIVKGAAGSGKDYGVRSTQGQRDKKEPTRNISLRRAKGMQAPVAEALDPKQKVIVPGVGQYDIETLQIQIAELLAELAHQASSLEPYYMREVQYKLNTNMLQLKLDALVDAYDNPTKSVTEMYNKFVQENVVSPEEAFILSAFHDLDDAIQHDPLDKIEHIYDTYMSFNMPISMNKFKQLFKTWKKTGKISKNWITENKRTKSIK